MSSDAMLMAKRYRDKAQALRDILIREQVTPSQYQTDLERIARWEKLRAQANLLDVQALLAEKGL